MVPDKFDAAISDVLKNPRFNAMFWSFAWVFGFYIALLLLNGPATTDIPDFLRISQDTSKVLASPERQLFYSSPLNFFLGDYLHLVSVPGFFIIHCSEIFLMLICMAAAIGNKMENGEQRLLYIIFLGLTPVWLITMKWIGKTDPVLIGGFFLCWGFRTRWRMLIVVVMIIAHRELGSLMTLALFFLDGRRDKNLFYALAVGNGLQLFYLYGVLDQVPGSRAQLMAGKAQAFLTAFSQLPALYVMSMFSWYWIFLLLEKPDKIELTVFGVGLVLALLNEDFTRDFTLAALPATIFHIERVVKSGRYAQMKKLWPLTLMHFQIAALGHFYAPNNSFVYLIMNRLNGGS